MSLLDTIIIPVIIVVTLITAVMMVTFVDTIASTSIADTLDDAGITLLDDGRPELLAFDEGLGLLYVFTLIASMVAGYFVRSHPIFAILMVIFMAFFVLFSAQLANAATIIVTTPSLVSAANDFPITLFMIDNLPLLTVVSMVLIGISLYGGLRREEFGSGSF
jgi:hypothetical protein